MDTRLRHSHPRFELGRRIVAECGVPPPLIEHLDVLEDIPCRVGPSGAVPMVYELALECPERLRFVSLLQVASLRDAHERK